MVLFRRWATFVVASLSASFLIFAGARAASADPIAVPSLVDDGVYPGAAQILAEQNVRLIGGDGHILLADCATPPVGDIGLIKVYTTEEAIGADGFGRVCFQVTAAAGWLTLQVPGVYEIRGDGQRTGTGHEVTAELESEAGEQITVDVDPDGSTQVGLGTDPDASPTMLLQLTAGKGLAPVTGSNTAIGKVFAHDDRMCSATLVAPQWILTAAGCFADNPLQPSITAGTPVATTGVVFPGHARMAINWVSPRAGRDVVLARLAGPVSDITPIALATAIAPTGTAHPATGYGRTATNWIYDQQQTAQITFTATSATTLSATSGPLVCKGMAGAPVLSGGKVAAVLSQAGQTGCFNATGSGSAVTAARTDDLITWFNAITTTTADHTWSLADMPAGASAGSPVTTAADGVYTGTGRPLTATAGAKWNTGDTFTPAVDLDGVSGSLVTAGPAVSTDGSFTVSVWVKPSAETGTVLSQDSANTSAFTLYAGPGGKSWNFGMPTGDEPIASWQSVTSAVNTVKAGQWTRLTATYSSTDGVMKLYVDGVEVGARKRTGSAITAAGPFRVGAQRDGGSSGSFFAGRISRVQAWNSVVEPERDQSAAGYYQRLATPTRFLDTRDGTGGTTGSVARNTVVRLKIAGVNGIPATGVTAVALNVATLLPQEGGYVTGWPDLTAQPYASSMTYAPGIVTAGFMIVPVGSNGYINLSPGSRSMIQHIPPLDTSTHILADVSGYFTTGNGAGTSSYTPVVPVRFADSRSGAGGHTGQFPANTTWDYKVTGVTVGSGVIPDGITAVAVNLTAVSATSGGFLTTWEQGEPKPTVSGLQFQPTGVYAGMAIIPVNATTGKFALSATTSTHIIIDILGYFAPGTSGQKYHSFASTTLLDTAVSGSAIPSGGSATVLPPNGTTGSNVTPVLTVIGSSDGGGGVVTAYPAAPSAPATSTLNLIGGRSVSNGAIVKTGTGGAVTVAVSGPSAHIAVSCNGYFADA